MAQTVVCLPEAASWPDCEISSCCAGLESADSWSACLKSRRLSFPLGHGGWILRYPTLSARSLARPSYDQAYFCCQSREGLLGPFRDIPSVLAGGAKCVRVAPTISRCFDDKERFTR